MIALKDSAPPLHLTMTAQAGRELVPFMRRNLIAAYKILRPPLVELSVVLVGDARMAELHKRFMRIAGPTDVLTFPLEADARGRVTGGEVVVCVPEAKRQAQLQGTTLRQEVLLYALHGMLHLCGYDDLTKIAYRTMHQKEDEILSQLGVGPVFHSDAGRLKPAAARRANRTVSRTTTPARRRKAAGAG